MRSPTARVASVVAGLRTQPRRRTIRVGALPLAQPQRAGSGRIGAVERVERHRIGLLAQAARQRGGQALRDVGRRKRRCAGSGLWWRCHVPVFSARGSDRRSSNDPQRGVGQDQTPLRDCYYESPRHVAMLDRACGKRATSFSGPSDLRFRSLDGLPAKALGGILNYQAGWGTGSRTAR